MSRDENSEDLIVFNLEQLRLLNRHMPDYVSYLRTPLKFNHEYLELHWQFTEQQIEKDLPRVLIQVPDKIENTEDIKKANYYWVEEKLYNDQFKRDKVGDETHGQFLKRCFDNLGLDPNLYNFIVGLYHQKNPYGFLGIAGNTVQTLIKILIRNQILAGNKLGGFYILPTSEKSIVLREICIVDSIKDNDPDVEDTIFKQYNDYRLQMVMDYLLTADDDSVKLDICSAKIIWVGDLNAVTVGDKKFIDDLRDRWSKFVEIQFGHGGGLTDFPLGSSDVLDALLNRKTPLDLPSDDFDNVIQQCSQQEYGTLSLANIKIESIEQVQLILNKYSDPRCFDLGGVQIEEFNSDDFEHARDLPNVVIAFDCKQLKKIQDPSSKIKSIIIDARQSIEVVGGSNFQKIKFSVRCRDLYDYFGSTNPNELIINPAFSAVTLGSSVVLSFEQAHAINQMCFQDPEQGEIKGMLQLLGLPGDESNVRGIYQNALFIAELKERFYPLILKFIGIIFEKLQLITAFDFADVNSFAYIFESINFNFLILTRDDLFDRLSDFNIEFDSIGYVVQRFFIHCLAADIVHRHDIESLMRNLKAYVDLEFNTEHFYLKPKEIMSYNDKSDLRLGKFFTIKPRSARQFDGDGFVVHRAKEIKQSFATDKKRNQMVVEYKAGFYEHIKYAILLCFAYGWHNLKIGDKQVNCSLTEIELENFNAFYQNCLAVYAKYFEFALQRPEDGVLLDGSEIMTSSIQSDEESVVLNVEDDDDKELAPPQFFDSKVVFFDDPECDAARKLLLKHQLIPGAESEVVGDDFENFNKKNCLVQ